MKNLSQLEKPVLPVRKPALVVHGGAWDIPDVKVKAHTDGLLAAIEEGWRFLKSGGTVLDAVEAAIVVLENDPTFDAGKGSILNTDGSIEMDASIMDGSSFKAGAVAALRNFPNPVKVARRVLEKTEHILLAGTGCEEFARREGFHSVPIEELLTPRELRRLELIIQDKQYRAAYSFGMKRGTVGCVAVDGDGNVAAGTSTGGTPKKLPGRVGDTPIIGCGTYAENGVGGVSCSGWGEAIMKVMLAKEVAELMRAESGAQASAEAGIRKLAAKADGLGGVICIDPGGEIGIAYNTPRMARGWMSDGMAEPAVRVE
jgi:beta-aspartyl-peptidase (threonine type)